MTTFYLIRHGEVNFELADQRNLVGSTREFVPLTDNGVRQVEQLSRQLLEHRAELILSSPLTRAMQSATIPSRQLNLPMRVEFDLRKWIPDPTNTYEGSDAVLTAYTELLEAGGEWPKEVKKSGNRCRPCASASPTPWPDTCIITASLSFVMVR